MAVSSPPQSPLPQGLPETLARLRSRIRRYVWIEGLALALAWLGLAFWISLGVDYLPVTVGSDEPTVLMRKFLLSGILAVLVFVLFWYILRRVFTRMSDRSMAVLLERRFRDFDDSLITTVEMHDRPDHAAQFNRDMLQHTGHMAQEQSQRVQVGQVFNRTPLVRNVLLAVFLCLTVVGYAAASPGDFEIWFRRAVLMDPDLTWPRRHHIEVDGPASRKVARGDDVSLTVRADTLYRVPDVVRIYYTTADGSSGRENLVREGKPRDGFQEYSYTFHGLLESVDFYMIGGDHRVDGYHLEVVDRPNAELTLHCEYPEYMQKTPLDQVVSGVMQLPYGTKITVNAAATKPLTEVKVVTATAEGQEESQPIVIDQGDEAFQYVIDRLTGDVTLLFSLLDTDSVRTREPIRLALAATADETPEVEMRLRGIGTHITPHVKIPTEGQILDDYGLARVFWEYAIDDREPVEVAFNKPPERRSELVFEEGDQEVLDLRELVREALKAERDRLRESGAEGEANKPADDKKSPPSEEEDEDELNDSPRQSDQTTDSAEADAEKFELQPGQKVVVSIKATDACNLADGPHTGTSNRYLLEVVTEEELRAILAARELFLRQRFEQILDEVLASRDLLYLVRFAPTSEAGRLEAGDDAPGEEEKPVGDAQDAQPKEEARQFTAQELLERAALSVQRAQLNCAKSGEEILGVAVGFEDIREELINNRLYTAELNERLKEGIADPLKRVSQQRFVELDESLDKLTVSLEDASQREQLLDASRKQIDAALLEMHEVLDRMLEHEEFNLAIKLIREILDEQRQNSEATKTYRADKLLNP